LCRKEIAYNKVGFGNLELIKTEVSILKELHHPNIIKYYDYDHIEASKTVHIYMEYCSNGDLREYIEELTNKNDVCGEDFVWRVLSQVTSALYLCHYGEDPLVDGRNVKGVGAHAIPVLGGTNRVILHRDIKPENSKSENGTLIPLCLNLQSSSAKTTV
jgi:serine/threonine protein kinase